MEQFNPITAAGNIKASFVDYITTSFQMADAGYADLLKQELAKEGYIAKGPYLDVAGSYQTGCSLHDLMETGEACALFPQLEAVPESEKELKLIRPLYSHQENALRKASAGNNLVVTTGTGSGKTECFLIPIIDALLREVEAGTLDCGVRAIVIYPMNALANDQMKRMRKLLKSYPKIKFGLYNGNTKHTQADAQKEYRKANGANAVPLANELISREKMQEEPPHILITNYSMLEYMMLRPKDDAVFLGAKLRYIILDEAHIYKGTTGMETAMLMRRLCARIAIVKNVQFILTSATLGDVDANDTIVDFANRLTGVSFKPENIIRSIDATPAMKAQNDYPMALFHQIALEKESLSTIFETFGIPDNCPTESDNAKLYDLLLHSQLFAWFSQYAKEPITIHALTQKLQRHYEISQEDVIDFISVCTRGEKENSCLVKAKYHFFVRALEGAYITLNEPKQLFLQRKDHISHGGKEQAVFEIAVCHDCGRIALLGEDDHGYLKQVARTSDSGGHRCGHYLIWDKSLGADTMADEAETDELGTAPDADDFVVCPMCGKLEPKANLDFGPICECEDTQYFHLKYINPTKSEKYICAACGFGHLRAFYLGSDAATAVLGTELFEQLPDAVIANAPAELAPSPTASLFGGLKKQQIIKKEKEKQFLCFSDSRSEAAFFAVYMEKSYEEFLRRRGMWHVVEQLRQEECWEISVGAFVKRLTRFFDSHKTFDIWNPAGTTDANELSEISKSNAWIAILNEMYNARRGTSLPALGVMSFQYAPDVIESVVSSIATWTNLSQDDTYNLLQQIIFDGVYSGAITPGASFALNDAEREYIFFSSKPKQLVRIKTAQHKSNISSWAPRMRTNGNYYRNTRLARLVEATGHTEAECNDFLCSMWDDLLSPDGETFAFDANSFYIRIPGHSKLQFYRCTTCGRITAYNVQGSCSTLKCPGQLQPMNPEVFFKDNHYTGLYKSVNMKPLQIKEHTAQLAKNRQTLYQQAFVDKKINALSCSTTFEMGVDVGGLETVYMRNVPPGPANYVQRAGRAGRASHTAAFVLTYAKLSSHDFTFYKNPVSIISGKMRAPIFALKNAKVISRHIFAVALSSFFQIHGEVYDGDNATNLLNEDGYEKLIAYLESKPESLKTLLKKSIPSGDDLHCVFGLDTFAWLDRLLGENGVLTLAVTEYREELAELEALKAQQVRAHDLQAAGQTERAIKQFRCAKEDGFHRKSLIDFLVRNNILPKYGFPVDTVELQVNASAKDGAGDSLQLARDLQMAVAEYAPGSEVIADGQLYTSRYIRKLPGKNNSTAWEKGFYCKCPSCEEPNFTKGQTGKPAERECISCGHKIPRNRWKATLEPRRGFWTEGSPTPVPMRKPERDYKTDDYYVGDVQRNVLEKRKFTVNDMEIELESTSNDSLVVIGKTDFVVCPCCGYATAEAVIPMDHRDARGYPCKNKDGTNKTSYLLSHTFKTDVVKIIFQSLDALDYSVMLSALYAILEGVSTELGIERTDIKGCLHQVTWADSSRPIYAMVLYDAVAGGAGHVRRIITDDGKVMYRVIKAAISLLDSCGCDSSCYLCIRNYYNQKIHDRLDRHSALRFLTQWLGEYFPVITDDPLPQQDTVISILDGTMVVSEEASSWVSIGGAYNIAHDFAKWDALQISRDCLGWPKLQINETILEPDFIWEVEQIAIFQELQENVSSLLGQLGWQCFDYHVNPEDLKSKLGGALLCPL